MAYRGHIKDGRVELDEPVDLANGTVVSTDVISRVEAVREEPIPSVTERLAPFIGKAVGHPKDAAENHDLYLYGVQKP